MSQYFQRILDYSDQMGLEILSRNEAEALVVVSDESKGVYNLIIDCEDPVLVLEQPICEVNLPSESKFKRLLQINRELIAGAFVLDAEGKWVLFRDTLQLENLDFNEFEGSINALSLGLAEFSKDLLALNKE